MQNPFIIPDGFTLEGHTDLVPGALRETRFKYRLAKPSAVAIVAGAFGEAKAAAKAKCVAEHTSNWRVVNDDGTEEQVAVTAEMLMNAPAAIQDTAFGYVTANIGPDVRREVGK